MLAALQDHADPVAALLRDMVDADGSIDTDWESFAEAAGDLRGCGPDLAGHVPLSNQGLAPKGIVSSCLDNPVAASEVLMILEPNGARTDLHPEAFRVVSWDDEAGAYRRYQFVPRGDEGLGVAIEPEFCLGCHEARSDAPSPTWHPIMNEMQNPWAQWNAEPGFSSFLFDQSIPGSFTGPVLARFLSEPLQSSAADLEPIVRAANDRIASARANEREDAGDLRSAIAWAEPLFCERDANYVSEIHGGGEVPWSFLVDPALKDGFLAAGELDPQWLFASRDHLLLSPAAADADGLAMMTVRSESARTWERTLLSRDVVSGHDVLAIRAIDWKRPVYSQTRCSLLEEAAGSVGQLTGTKAEVARELIEAAMTLETSDGPLGLLDLDDLAVVSDEADASKLFDGEVGELLESPAAFGQRVDTYLRTIETEDLRDDLEASRLDLGCEARSRSLIAPLIPGTEDCLP